MGKAGKYGPELITDADGGTILRVGSYTSRAEKGRSIFIDKRMTDPAARIRDMDEKQTDRMGITISPLFYLYWAEAEIAIEFSRIQNDALAHFCRDYPHRLFFMATLPMQDVSASISELKRAVEELGAKGVNLGTDDFSGRDFDNQDFWPLYEKIEAYELPIFVHPYPLSMATGQLDRYNLSWIAGYVHQETVAFCHFAFSGVLDTFPNLKICIPHGGGSVPYQWGRLEYAAQKMPDVRAKKSLREYLHQFYFDILIHDIRARRYLVDFMGADNLVVGDNYLGWDAVDGFQLVQELDLPERDHIKIMGDNAVRLFNLDPQPLSGTCAAAY